MLVQSMEKEMAAHSSILAWEIPWTEEHGRLQSTGSQRVRHDLAIKQHGWLTLLYSRKSHNIVKKSYFHKKTKILTKLKF